MMRRLLFGPLAAGLLLLSSCEHKPDSSFLDMVQQAVSAKCSFLPAIKAIVSIMSLHPGWTTVTDIADRICAVVPQQITPRVAPPAPPVLDGERVTGWFVR